MHRAELTASEQRVLGCLIEKRWTTPDQYPLSLNALRLACNQSTNRDPVTAYDDATVRAAAQRLARYGLARLASGHNSRAIKYRHLAEEGLGLSRPELAVLAVLMLRGPQTPGELKLRSERMQSLGSLAELDTVLGLLAERGYVRNLGRRPGQKEDRYEQLLGGSAGSDAAAPQPATVEPQPATAEPQPATAEPQPDTAGPPPDQPDRLERRVAALEAAVDRLSAELDSLRGSPELSFSTARVDTGPGGELVTAMRAEMASVYEGLVLDGDAMPKAGPAELGPPAGTFIIGTVAGRPVCCGGVKRLDDGACEIKRMYVVPDLRGRGVARRLLHELEDRARSLGYVTARLDTGPRQPGAQGLYESEGYVATSNFNGNPVASFWGEKPLG